MAARVLVVGAGVIGLSCAVRLAESGREVHVLARDLPLETTSAVAAALWYPYRALPRERVARWGQVTYDELLRIALEHPQAGVSVVSGRELLRSAAPDPWWRDAIRPAESAVGSAFARLTQPEIPQGYADGWRFSAPVADMSVYLPWLVGRLEAAGGTCTRAWLGELPHAPLVVNCSGIAARALAADDSVGPVRGEVVLVEQPGISEWLLDATDHAELTYIVPRLETVVIGGSAVEGDWGRAPDPATRAEILARASALVPQLRGARVVAHLVGLRPARPAVRLETERTAGRAVVHCYGHGGAGVTLSWGCADEVLAQVARLDG